MDISVTRPDDLEWLDGVTTLVSLAPHNDVGRRHLGLPVGQIIPLIVPLRESSSLPDATTTGWTLLAPGDRSVYQGCHTVYHRLDVDAF